MGFKMRSFKVEIDPTANQQVKIKKDQGTCRFVWNLYISENERRFEENKANNKKHKLMSVTEFENWLKDEYIPKTGNTWILEASSKARHEVLRTVVKTYKNFFKGKCGKPKYKKKSSEHDSKIYFVRNDANVIIKADRHYVQVPCIGRLHLKEKGYIPKTNENVRIIKGNTYYEAGKFYLSVLVEYREVVVPEYKKREQGVGIDVGIKTYASTSDNKQYPNITKSKKFRKKNKQIKRKQRSLQRKLDSYKVRKKKDPNATCSNLRKNIQQVAKLHKKKVQVRESYLWQIASEIMDENPAYVVMEDLNIKGMLKNRHLAKAISECAWYSFRQKIRFICAKRKIEFRLADRFYPSSKTCHKCGFIKEDLTLKDRTYICPECGEVIDRDLNASLNLRDTTKYTVVENETEMF